MPVQSPSLVFFVNEHSIAIVGVFHQRTQHISIEVFTNDLEDERSLAINTHELKTPTTAVAPQRIYD